MKIHTSVKSFFVPAENSASTDPSETSLLERLKKILLRHLIPQVRSKLFSLLPKEIQPPAKKVISAVLFVKKGPGIAEKAKRGLLEIEKENYEEGVRTAGLALCEAGSFIPLLTSDPRLLLAGIGLEIAADLTESYDEVQKGDYLEAASALLSVAIRTKKAINIASKIETPPKIEEKDTPLPSIEE